MLLSQGAELAAKQVELAELRETIRYRELYIEKLKLQLARLRRFQFGRSSEKLALKIEQLELLIEELKIPSPAAGISPSSEKSRPARRPLPELPPRDAVIYAPACNRPSCGGALRPAGEDVAEMLEYVPEHQKVIQHVRPSVWPRQRLTQCQSLKSQTSLRCLQQDRASRRAVPPHRAWKGGARTPGTRAGQQILRPPAAIPTVRDLRALRRPPRTLDAWRLGW